MADAEKHQNSLVSDQHVNLPSIKTMLTFIILILLFYALFSGLTYQFYASFLFLFYSLIRKMWVAVVCLGIFQTLLMIPFRIINLRQSVHLEKFEEELAGFEVKKKKQSFLKQSFRQGKTTFLWYLINFTAQTISYFSIGRLFVTDFYAKPLRPELLYSFVSYPDYPIQDTFFKIPYPVIVKTVDFGMNIVWIFWAAVLVYKLLVSKILPFLLKKTNPYMPSDKESSFFSILRKVIKKTQGATITLLILGWLLIRNFPTGWQVRIFSGDVSQPNPTFNLITAVTTFVIIIWLDLPKIRAKVKLMRQANIDVKILTKEQKNFFKNSFKKAFVLGLGAYFITNLIPSAFELSIFTLEIISFSSPFTLDRLIFAAQQKINVLPEEK